jgi:hypothetical protein
MLFTSRFIPLADRFYLAMLGYNRPEPASRDERKRWQECRLGNFRTATHSFAVVNRFFLFSQVLHRNQLGKLGGLLGQVDAQFARMTS